MSSTPENRIKNRCCRALDTLGERCYYFKPATGGYGRSGVGDIVGWIDGKAFFIECKAGKGKMTELQKFEMGKAAIAGARTWMVNEQNIEDFEVWVSAKKAD